MSRPADDATIERHRLIAGDIFQMADILADILTDRIELGGDPRVNGLNIEAIRVLQDSLIHHFKVLEIEGLSQDDAIAQLKITSDVHVKLNEIMSTLRVRALDL